MKAWPEKAPMKAWLEKAPTQPEKAGDEGPAGEGLERRSRTKVRGEDLERRSQTKA
jgi:hypothetical protein